MKKKSAGRLLLAKGVVAAFSCVAPMSAFAGDGNVAGTAPPVMDEVVVSATRTTETRGTVVNSVEIIENADLAESPATSLGDLLAEKPGIDWRTRGNYGGAAEEIHIRGMQGDETQVLMNGVSVNSPSVGSADMGRLSRNAIDRIEVVKGSGSVLYGSGAMAGTVNITTKRPQRDLVDLSVSAGYGSNHQYEVAAEQGAYLWRDLGYYVTVNSRETDGFRDNGDLEHRDASLNLIWSGRMVDISVYGDHLERDYGVPGIKPPAGTNDFFLGGVKFYSADSASLVDRGSDEDSHLTLRVKATPCRWLDVTMQASRSLMENYFLQRYNATGWTTLAGEGIKTWVNNEMDKIETYAEVRPLDGLTVLAGVDYQEHGWGTKSVELDTSGNDKAGPSVNNADIFTKGVYTEVQYQPVDLFKLLAGVRQENHSTFGIESLPLFGAVLNPLPGTAIKLSRGKHFKAPTPNDLFWPEDLFVRGNPNLAPQTGWHTDVTLEQALLHDTLAVSVSWFDWDITDKIDWAENPAFPGPFGNKWTPTNMNEAAGHGLELGLRYDPIDAIGFTAGLTYTHAEEITPVLHRDAQYVPSLAWDASLVHRAGNGFRTTVRVTHEDERPFYRSSSDTVPTDILASYYVVDFETEKAFDDHWLVQFSVNNVFNRDYDSYVGSFTNSAGSRQYGRYPGAGQAFSFGVTYRY